MINSYSFDDFWGPLVVVVSVNLLENGVIEEVDAFMREEIFYNRVSPLLVVVQRVLLGIIRGNENRQESPSPKKRLNSSRKHLGIIVKLFSVSFGYLPPSHRR